MDALFIPKKKIEKLLPLRERTYFTYLGSVRGGCLFEPSIQEGS